MHSARLNWREAKEKRPLSTFWYMELCRRLNNTAISPYMKTTGIQNPYIWFKQWIVRVEIVIHSKLAYQNRLTATATQLEERTGSDQHLLPLYNLNMYNIHANMKNGLFVRIARFSTRLWFHRHSAGCKTYVFAVSTKAEKKLYSIQVFLICTIQDICEWECWFLVNGKIFVDSQQWKIYDCL